MKYYVKIYDQQGNKTKVYNKYGDEITLKISENGFLLIPPETCGENGFPFRIETNAKIIECPFNRALFQIEANKATYIDCDSCGIVYLDVEKVEKLECCDNLMEVIYAPNATEIKAYRCSRLTDINAPKCEKIICSSCRFDITNINETDFPALRSLVIQNTNITEIKHPTLKFLSADTNELSVLELPNIEEILLTNENQLSKLDVPQAKKLYCDYTSCETIIADNAKTISLNNNRFLKEVFAQNAEFFSIIECDNIEVLQIPKDVAIEGVTKTMETIFNLRR